MLRVSDVVAVAVSAVVFVYVVVAVVKRVGVPLVVVFCVWCSLSCL